MKPEEDPKSVHFFAPGFQGTISLLLTVPFSDLSCLHGKSGPRTWIWDKPELPKWAQTQPGLHNIILSWRTWTRKKKRIQVLQREVSEAKEHWLFFPRARIQFLVSMWRLTTIITPVPEDSMPSGLWGHQEHMWYADIHIGKNLHKQKKQTLLKEEFRGWLYLPQHLQPPASVPSAGDHQGHRS